MENLFQELYLSSYKKKLEGTKYYLASVKPVSGGECIPENIMFSGILILFH